MARNDILEMKKMLEALLRSDGLVEWVGGYVYGRTSQDDPFIILYPASDKLTEKVCRVYEHAFKKLPNFIPTDNVPADTENNPSKGQAQRAGIYHTCPPFKIVMHLGKDTQMGREKRFGDVLYVPPQPPLRTPPPAENGPNSGTRALPNRTQGEDEEAKARWRVEAATSDDPFIFDTAILKLDSWYQNSNNVKKFRELLFGPWDASHTERYVVGLEAYASKRRELNGSLSAADAHARAKVHALAIVEGKSQ